MSKNSPTSGFLSNLFASAAWDAIKRGLGCSLMTGLATALWEKLKHGSLDWYAIGGMFILTLTVVLSIFWKRQKSVIPPDTTVETAKSEPKLKIHRATWGGGRPHAEVSVTDQLKDSFRDGLVIRVDHDLGGLTHDPAFGAQKRLEIDYSYDSDTIIHLSRLEPPPGETMRLVLPEDTEVARLRDEIAKLTQPPTVRLADPQVYAGFFDSRGSAVGVNNEGYITLINRGGSDALNVCIGTIHLKESLIKFPMTADSIQPGKVKHSYPEIKTHDNRNQRNTDVLQLLCSEYLSLGDRSIHELVVPLGVTYQDVSHNLYEGVCELVFDPSAHSRVSRHGQNGSIVVVSTRNHQFRKIALAV